MKKILPPVLFVLFIIVMGMICWGMGSPHNIGYPYSLIGLPFVVAGLMLAVAGKILFRKLSTNIMTFDEPDKLVTEGVFKYTRNPMYLGLVVAMMGFSILMGSAITSILLTALFLLITDRWYIAFEEKIMHRKFGLDYEEYCRKVRRWI
ncbi:isoprenylcysteine carboxylmethyltransferase family protein [Motilimonas sp. E26]|uniref:methyltransferase family protein n=1 Tax=Motilimonas sp. E26 TaxID=2865674 RepID=UPI001E4E09E4|nr:isoprenylcysteine carboxylmethyltransferase family protein [Motilimonas sp. E26]MCE0557686.1 isoprenylcysteine carboxylmethyltransferase family protein [Motilimonas sp. E26]